MKRNVFFKLISLVVAAAFISLFIESFIFNYNAIFKSKFIQEYNFVDGLEKKDLECKQIDDDVIVSIEFPKAKYISDFEFNCKAKRDSKYTINIMYETEFGYKQKISIEDDIYKALNKGCTLINKKVKRLEFRYNINDIPKIQYIEISNKFTFCYERYFLFFSIIFIILFIIFYKKVLFDKLEWLFAISALLLGVSIILITGLKREGWDEAIHFSRAYSYSFSNEIEWNNAVVNSDIMSYNTVAERNLVKRYYNKVYIKGNKNYEEKELYIPYNMRCYILQSVMIFIARSLKFSFYRMYLFGKLGNLLFYIFCFFVSIKIAKKGKVIITLLGLMPTPLFLACSYTYDTALLAMLTLAFTIWMNEMIDKDKKISAKTLVMLDILFVYGCSSKAVYIPLLLLLLLLPESKFDSRIQMYFIKGLTVFLFVLVMGSFVMPVTNNTMAGNISFGGDARGGDTGSVRQMKSILHSPIAYIVLFFKSIFSLDNFGIFGSDSGLITSLEFLSFSNIGIMNDKFIFLLLPIFLTISLVNAEDYENFILNIKQKMGLAFILLMTIGLVWTALYLDFTEIGMDHIYGVQARYYIPITLPFLYLITNDKIKVNVKYNTIKSLNVTLVMFILMFGIYYNLFLKIFN